MATWVAEIHSGHTKLPSWSKKTLFAKTKPSEEWHQQIDFLVGHLKPSDHKFPWSLLRKHTDHYVKKKGKISPTEIDIKLAALIEKHEARDIAIAACAHAMSPTAVRALLNVELNVAPSTFFGLEVYLQSLIATNFSSPTAVSNLEALWAKRLLPYAKHGVGAAGRYLEGVCVVLRTSDTPNMNVLPDFAILARRAFKDFATQLEGLKLRNRWIAAYAAVAWMSSLAQSTPATTPPGTLMPEHLLDIQFPIWRIWANWKPNLDRIAVLDRMDSYKRGPLPDVLALEGPDFINGTHASLRDGLVAQYGAAKPIVRFRGLVIEVPNSTKDDMADILSRVMMALSRAVKGGEGPFKAFVQLLILRPINLEAMQILEALSKIKDTPKFHVHEAVLEVFTARGTIGGQHIASLQHFICALDDASGEDLRKVLLRSWLVQGIEKCFRECQAAVRTHIDSGLAWTHLALEYHTFCAIVKGSVNCLPLLEDSVQKQLDVLPSAELLRTVVEIYIATGGENAFKAVSCADALRSAIESWCTDRLLERGTMSHSSEKMVDAIVELWNETATKDKSNLARRSLALIASRLAGTDLVLRCDLFKNIPQLPEESVAALLSVLEKSKGCAAVLALTKFFATTDGIDSCWKKILYAIIADLQNMEMIDYALESMKAWQWTAFMLDLYALFTDVIMNSKASPPFILQSHFHLWVQQLSTYLPAITRLEEVIGDKTPAVQVILRGGEGLWVEDLLRILEAITQASEQPAEKLMHAVVAKLSKDGKNASEISKCLKALLCAAPEGLAACERVWDAKHGVVNIPGLETCNEPAQIDPVAANLRLLERNLNARSARRNGIIVSSSQRNSLAQSFTTCRSTRTTLTDTVTEVIIAGYIQDDDTIDSDKAAIKALANVLNLEIYQFGIPREKLEEATRYFEEQEEKLIAEAERLEGIQKALKARDPTGTAILLAQLGIDDVSPLDEELSSLPVEVIGAVEKHGDNEVEISFPLTSYTELQLGAMGVGAAKTLLIRLFIDHTGGLPPSYCVHLDIDSMDHANGHTPWVCLSESKAPETRYCTQILTPYTWQISRVLHRYLKTSGPGIAELYAVLKASMEDLAYGCIVCGQSHNTRNAQLRRSTSCSLSSCMRIWNNLPLDVRIPEIRTDSFAVDMILTTVYAAANSGRTELLPGCPISNTASVQAILNTFPNLTTLRTCPSLSSTLKAFHKDAEKLLVWALTHFRGFIATASGICKIPGMPIGTHQFVLANASPRLETDFAAKLPRHNPAFKVLFHGTSLDRLPSILVQGLRIHSGTSLQRTGAAHGKGIYMGEEPATSFAYSPSAVSWRNSGLNNMRLLLGCEVIGAGRSVSPGIHVITDEKIVMVRYVFLLPHGAYAPNANHITPAMASAMSALRSGSV